MSQKLDIIIFGATGCTGKYTVLLMEKISKTKTRDLTWGIAGRSEGKLQNMLDDCRKQSGISFGNIPIIIADVQEEQSIKNMVRKARIIINCCGPFRFFGEPVVKACVEEGTHLVDVSAEIQYMEKMQLKYHKQAQEKGIYIISACGYASIPVDLGTVYLQQNFSGTLNSVSAYLQYWEEDNSAAGSAVNYGTWESMIYTLAHGKELKEIRRQLFPNPLPNLKPKLKLKVIPHKCHGTDAWAFPAHATDLPVVKRTQRLFYERHSKRPVQIETYFAVQSFIYMVPLVICGLMLLLLLKFSWGKKLLLKYPEFFSLGFVTRQTPSHERAEKGLFRTTLYGEGWKEVAPHADYQFTTPPNKAVVLNISGRNPAYGATSAFLVLAAITVITETNKMPRDGGVYPPGYAFANTSLIQRLKENDINVEVLYEKDLNTSTSDK